MSNEGGVHVVASGDEIEHCVLCSAPTQYKRSDPIDMRKGYVEGCGQLCGPCDAKVEV